MRAKRALAAYAAMLLAALTACSGSGGSGPSSSPAPTTQAVTTPPSTSSSTSVPPHPVTPTVPADVPTTGPNTKAGEKPPVMPVAATQHTAAGAQAFAAFFVRTIDWGYATISGAYMAKYSEDACVGCRAFIDTFDSDRKSRHEYVGGRITVRSDAPTKHPVVRGAEYTIIVTFDSESFEETTASGSYVNADEAHTARRIEVSTSWVGSGWRVLQIGLEQ